MSQNNQALIRQIVAHVRCAVCGHHYGKSDIQVVDHRDKIWAMKVSCRECRTESLLLAVTENDGMRPIYTDLLPDEWDRFIDEPALGIDDVIAVHEYLETYDGDFTDILEDPLPDE